MIFCFHIENAEGYTPFAPPSRQTMLTKNLNDALPASLAGAIGERSRNNRILRSRPASARPPSSAINPIVASARQEIANHLPQSARDARVLQKNPVQRSVVQRLGMYPWADVNRQSPPLHHLSAKPPPPKLAALDDKRRERTPRPPASSPPAFRRHQPRACRPVALEPVKKRAPLADLTDGQRALGSRLGKLNQQPVSPPRREMRTDLEELPSPQARSVVELRKPLLPPPPTTHRDSASSPRPEALHHQPPPLSPQPPSPGLQPPSPPPPPQQPPPQQLAEQQHQQREADESPPRAEQVRALYRRQAPPAAAMSSPVCTLTQSLVDDAEALVAKRRSILAAAAEARLARNAAA